MSSVDEGNAGPVATDNQSMFSQLGTRVRTTRRACLDQQAKLRIKMKRLAQIVKSDQLYGPWGSSSGPDFNLTQSCWI